VKEVYKNPTPELVEVRSITGKIKWCSKSPYDIEIQKMRKQPIRNKRELFSSGDPKWCSKTQYFHLKNQKRCRKTQYVRNRAKASGGNPEEV
jgi:hypothetical protein